MEHCSNTYEWCAEGVSPHIQEMQKIPYLEGSIDYRDLFSKNGLFCCRNIHKLDSRERRLLEQMEAQSTLEYAIIENGQFHGFIGLDDYKICRPWTDEQIEALIIIGKLLSVFLLKDHMHASLTELIGNLQNVIDNQAAWIYVLNPDTYILRYINNTVRQTLPDAGVGETCYKVFFHRGCPCEDCILKKVFETGQSTVELYNPEMGGWILAQVAGVIWNQQKACLISCKDITAYRY